MNIQKKEQIWEVGIRIVAILILLSCNIFFISMLIVAIIDFSWKSFLMIPFCIIMLIGGNALPIMALLKKGRESFWKATRQENYTDSIEEIEKQE